MNENKPCHALQKYPQPKSSLLRTAIGFCTVERVNEPALLVDDQEGNQNKRRWVAVVEGSEVCKQNLKSSASEPKTLSRPAGKLGVTRDASG